MITVADIKLVTPLLRNLDTLNTVDNSKTYLLGLASFPPQIKKNVYDLKNVIVEDLRVLGETKHNGVWMAKAVLHASNSISESIQTELSANVAEILWLACRHYPSSPKDWSKTRKLVSLYASQKNFGVLEFTSSANGRAR